MKALTLYITTLFLLLLTACTDETYTSAPNGQTHSGYQFTVSIPAPMTAVTRALGNELTADYVTKLPMHVLVFDENGFFLAFQEAAVDSFDPNTQTGTYTVDLPVSDRPCALHFVLGNVDFGTYTPADSETGIFSKLTVGDNTDVYWQREEVKYISKDEETGTITAPPLTDEDHVVRLIRNFAQISVEAATGLENSFTLEGFVVIHHINRGTVAPFSGSEENGGFATFTGVNSYDSFTEKNPGFGGCNPPQDGSNLIEWEDINSTENFPFNSDPKYVYERNQDNAQNPAYLLLKATYNGTTCYYKLDLVSFDEDTYVTSYLNLYRNFHYQVNITSVAGAGYSSPEEAIQNVASNNLSASIEASQVNQIEDGTGNKLSVDELDIMLVSTAPYTLGYNYVHEGVEHNTTPDYVNVTPVGGNDGDGYNHQAVQSITCNGDGTITIKPAATLPEVMQTQELIVAGKSGLSRRVTVRVRKKFDFAAVDCDNAESTIGAEMTLVVRLPDNMPTAVFPLTLDIEPKKKSLYPDVSKNRIPVTSQGNYTFSYQATVTYNDYLNNHTFFFHFKTNMADSATEIAVTNPYFNDGATSFENEDKMYGFDAKLIGDNITGGNGEYLFNTYETQGEKVTLEFKMHEEGDGYSSSDEEHIVEIFSAYFDLQGATSETGTITVRKDGQCILYTPDDIYGTHSITFTVTRNLASETIQLSALDHHTATLDYTVPPVSVNLDYYYNRNNSGDVPDGTEISIYYNDKLIDEQEVSKGQISTNAYAGLELTDELTFQRSIDVSSSWWHNYVTFEGTISVQALLGDNPPLTLTRQY